VLRQAQAFPQSPDAARRPPAGAVPAPLPPPPSKLASNPVEAQWFASASQGPTAYVEADEPSASSGTSWAFLGALLEIIVDVITD
jgi:hypothetical protein